MIIRSVKLHNFGIYSGDHAFDLMPQDGERFHRPIILFRGKNGVGKSTLVEAIRFCLHGRLSLGSRTRQREYEDYLKRRLHRSATGETAVRAFIQLEFDHVMLGRRKQYRVIRSWEANNQRILSNVHIWVDEVPLTEDEEEKEYLLRELVPPGVAELFFFDGEKIATLSETGEASDTLLADTLKNLLGLHLVEQLDQDLDVYLTRQTGIREMQQYQDELAQLHGEEAGFEQQQEEIRAQLADCRRHLNAKREEIALLEAQIAREGGSYADSQTAYEEERRQITEAIVQIEQEIHELSRNILPFSVAPKLLRAVHNRLQREATYEQWESSQKLLSEIKGRIIKEAATDAYWTGVMDPPDEQGRKRHIQNIIQLVQEYSESPIPEAEVVHRVSSDMRGVLLNWIEEALDAAPQQLAKALRKREALQNQLATIDEGLARVPVAQILQPLRENRLQLEREMGRLEAEQDRLSAEDKRLTYHLERIAGSQRRVIEQMVEINMDEERIKLAARTQLLLDRYQQQLTRHKLNQLATQLAKRFNQLSRKRNFIERVTIDPESFQVTLYQAGKPFPRTQLSAGEDQIFAIATLWALREVSSRPLPVIIDTPLSRLDDEHRRAMLAELIPQVAQQVIVLATTTEIDDKTFAFLQPGVSKAYLLSERADGAVTQATEQTIARQVPLIALEEIMTNAA